VEGVVKEGEQVVGVSAGGEQMFADVIIAADGASSFLAQQAGLRGPVKPEESAVGVKEVIGLPRETIQDRFRLNGDEGAAYNIVGFATRGVTGGGFLYTNLESLSIGLVIHLEDLMRARLKPAEIFEDFLAHPMIAPLIRGGKLLEYGAHLVPEVGFKRMPALSTGGMLLVGDAAGLGVNNGFVIRGMDLAIGSAAAAAETVLAARAAGDFSASGLARYRKKLDESFVLADMRTYAGTGDFFKNERLYKDYPALLAGILTNIYRQEGVPKKHVTASLLEALRASPVGLLDLARDLLKGARSL
jgi:electron transfer flavoprotein-quinone oxidoreductase